ncbi:MAG: endonuclease III domain-containing protein [Arenicellales bacterium]|jgi:endonuclease-3 related protein
MSQSNQFQRIYDILNSHYGPQHWWPADTPFEVMVGAVLVQNTAWKNASTAITSLKQAGLMSPTAINATSIYDLAALIVSSGYFNIKARRLKALCQWLADKNEIDQLKQLPLKELRKELLGVHGIGPETADDILLYALDKPVFVIDAYTRRLFSRLGLIQHDDGYENLRRGFEQALDESVELYNQYHALIVVHAKGICQKQPQCEKCCLAEDCIGIQHLTRV